MPTGSFSSGLNPDSRAGGSITGSASPSQPRAASGFSYNPSPNAPPLYIPSPNATSPYPAQTGSSLNPNLGSWGMAALRNQSTSMSASNQLAQQAVGGIPDVTSMLSTYYGPQNVLAQQQLARQQAQLGMVPEDVSYRTGAIQRDTDLARRGLGLDRQALGVDASLTKAQQANLARLKAILGQQYGLEGEQLTNQLAQLGIDEAKLKDMAKRQTFDLRSGLTARGAFNTVANTRGTGRINRDLIYGLGGIANQRTAADIAHRGNVLGLDEKGIGLENQGAQLAARLANNGIDLARIGLSEEGLTNSLNDGLRQIGLDGVTSLNGILDAIGGTNAQQAQLAWTIYGELEKLAQAGLLPGVTPEQLAAIRAGMEAGSSNPQNPGQRSDAVYAGGSYQR